MDQVIFRFRQRLQSLAEVGIVFFEWLPNGKDNAISIAVDENVKLLIWVESRDEYDPEFRITEASELAGELYLNDLSDHEVSMLARPDLKVTETTPDGVQCQRIIKRAVSLIHLGMARFLQVLTVKFGQYWLVPVEYYKWDSRFTSLGFHAWIELRLARSLDNGVSWLSFEPDMSESLGRLVFSSSGATEPDPSLYISRDDWIRVSQILNEPKDDHPESLELIWSLYSDIKRELDTGAYSFAYVLATTTLELTLNYYLRSWSDASPQLTSAVQPLRALKLPAKFCSVAFSSGISPSCIELTLDAIKIRNSVVHEGREVSETELDPLEATVQSIALLLPGQPYRLPVNPDAFWS